MTAYYNEHDPVSAEWLRRLVSAGLIAAGEVDERDIRDVTPEELSGFVQCHFFAGIGIWSGALRAAGWSDDRPVWSGSCPCQPFSAAGRGDGVADERHLWPHWLHLIQQRRPDVVVGEQVASKDGLGWNDLVSADLERAGYAFGSVNLCAAGFGMGWRGSAYAEWLERALRSCPDSMVARQLRDFADWADQSLALGGLHIRQRQYFVGVAHAYGEGGGARLRGSGPRWLGRDAAPGGGGHDGVANALRDGAGPVPGDGEGEKAATLGGYRDSQGASAPVGHGRTPDGMEHGEREGLERQRGGPPGAPDAERNREETGRPAATASGVDRLVDSHDAGPSASEADGGRSPFDWLLCRDGSWRAARPGTLPLAHAVAGRVGKLRAYGNGLDFETATEFCRAVRELTDEGQA